jgi:hypothetical protein
MNTNAVYLFCFARGSDLDDRAPEGTGLDRSSPLLLQRLRDLVAVVSRAPLDELTGESAEERMRDVEWLAPRALLHERVIEQVAVATPVLPVRMGTIFSSPEKLTELMARHHDRILGFLDRVAGHDEWAVKLFIDRPRAMEARVSAALAALPAPLSSSPGTRYMQEQRIRSQADAAVKEWLAATRDRIRDQLVALASEFVERKPLPFGSNQIPGQMTANWAFLLKRDSVAAFRARVRELDAEYAGSGLRLQEAGAWPPYSFTPALTVAEPVEQPPSGGPGAE